MITADLIKDIQHINIPHSRKYFYLWLVCRFGFNCYFNYDLCSKEYGMSKRQIQRYVRDLVEHKMIYRIDAKRGRPAKLMLDRDIYIKLKAS